MRSSNLGKLEPKIKLTKLQTFLSKIEPSTLELMKKYIHDHSQEYDNLKYDKIKLVHDLYMIVKFKENESAIIDKKKIDDICQQLSEQFGFSTTTIRERIQKKLSDVSQADLIEHVKLGIGFTFNTRRQLMPVRSFGEQKYGFRPYDSKVHNKPEVKSESRNRQIHPKVQVMHGKQGKKQKQRSHGNSIGVKSVKSEKNGDEFNQFREDSEQIGKDFIVIIQIGNKYNVKVETNQQFIQNNKQITQHIKQFDQTTQPDIKKEYQQQHNTNQDHLQDQPTHQTNNFNQNHQNGPTDFRLPQIENPTKSSQQNKIHVQQSPFPKLEQSIDSLYKQNNQFSNLMDEKSSQKNSQKQHLRWTPQQDEYLIDCLNNQNVMEKWEMIEKLQTLRKFKLGSDILARIKFLDRQISIGLMTFLLQESD